MVDATHPIRSDIDAPADAEKKSPSRRFGARFPKAALSPAILLIIWEIAAQLGLIEVQFFPAPSTIFTAS